jgi:hypothetical protein
VTTNYDSEIEKALEKRPGAPYSTHEKSFEQADWDKLIVFAVALLKLAIQHEPQVLSVARIVEPANVNIDSREDR